MKWGFPMFACAMVVFGFICLGAVTRSHNSTPRWLP